MEIKEIEPQHALAIRMTVKHEEIGKALNTILPEVMGYLRKKEITPSGPPFARYLMMENGMVELEGGLPVSEGADGEGRIAPLEIPGGKVAAGWHIGPYEKLGESARALYAWITEQKMAPSGAYLERYWTDPGISPDPTTWKTELLCPVN